MPHKLNIVPFQVVRSLRKPLSANNDVTYYRKGVSKSGAKYTASERLRGITDVVECMTSYDFFLYDAHELFIIKNESFLVNGMGILG